MALLQRRRELLSGMIDLSKCVIANISAVTYNGSAHTPTPAVTYNGKALVAGTHFTYTYSNNTNAGTATCTINAVDKKSKGSQSKNFTINKASGYITLNSTAAGSCAWNSTGSRTVTSSHGGTITVSSSNTTTCTASISGSTVTITGKNYNSRSASTITVSCAATTNYNAASASFSWTCSRTAGSITLSKSSMTISGAAGTTGTFTVTARTGSGTLSVSSATTSKVTASISGTTITCKSVASGSSVVTVTQAAAGNYNSATASCTVTASVIPVKAFNACTMAEINQICEAGLAATYVSNGTWTIGDTNSNATYGSYSGIQLVHVLTDAQRGSSYYNTDGHIVVQFVKTVTTSQYMSSNTAQKYFNGTLHTMCNSTIYNGLNSDFKNVLKPWNCIVGKENTGSGSITGTYNQNVYLAAPTAKEVGSSNSYNSTENSSTFTFTYYSTDSQNRRKKSGASSFWWLRSPSYYNGGGYRAYRVSDGGIVDDYGVFNTIGVAPIGCI